MTIKGQIYVECSECGLVAENSDEELRDWEYIDPTEFEVSIP